MREKYESLPLATLRDLAKAREMTGISTLKKAELVEAMLEQDEKDKLKTEKYEAAINKFTHNKNAKGQELSGLSKRRLFDISLAIKMHKGKVPQSNINTAQEVYNRGIQLLRQECQKTGKNFKNQLHGYNSAVQKFFEGSIKLKYVTQ